MKWLAIFILGFSIGCAKKIIAPPTIEVPVQAVEKKFADIPVLEEVPEYVTPPIDIFDATVYFELDESEVIDYTALEPLAATLTQFVDVTATIEGNACPLETNAYNYSLGLRRAIAVKDYFVMKGVDPMKILLKSNGEEDLVTNNPIAYSQNRRTEVHLIEAR